MPRVTSTPGPLAMPMAAKLPRGKQGLRPRDTPPVGLTTTRPSLPGPDNAQCRRAARAQGPGGVGGPTTRLGQPHRYLSFCRRMA